ncbi:MAG: helix-turn-helix transcriptional regulator [Sinomonas sp.]|nr:helix-turn-helix transcriptional regulator [Sinomonas sp.]
MCHPAWGPAHAPAPHPRDLARVRRVRDLIDRDYAERALDVNALALGAGMPASQLTGEFTHAYGMSPHAYVAARRHERAAALIRNRDAAAEPQPA